MLLYYLLRAPAVCIHDHRRVTEFRWPTSHDFAHRLDACSGQSRRRRQERWIVEMIGVCEQGLSSSMALWFFYYSNKLVRQHIYALMMPKGSFPLHVFHCHETGKYHETQRWNTVKQNEIEQWNTMRQQWNSAVKHHETMKSQKSI